MQDWLLRVAVPLSRIVLDLVVAIEPTGRVLVFRQAGGGEPQWVFIADRTLGHERGCERAPSASMNAATSPAAPARTTPLPIRTKGLCAFCTAARAAVIDLCGATGTATGGT
jgi:hypothetical protein